MSTVNAGNEERPKGLPEEHLAKVELTFQIRQIIRARRLTSVKAATLLGIKQQHVSALMKGHLDVNACFALSISLNGD